MKEIEITIFGKKALVREEWALMFLKKASLVREALEHKENLKNSPEALSKILDVVMREIQRTNRRIAKTGAYVTFI